MYSCIAISELQGSVVGVNEARASLTVIGECAQSQLCMPIISKVLN